MTSLDLEWVLTAQVHIGPRRSLGAWMGGERFQVDILGGTVEGNGFSGEVLPGTDRQWLRPDGVKELKASYDIRLSDGTVLAVTNEVLIEERTGANRYACSVARLMAPHGRWDFFNRRILVGDLQSLRPAQEAVRVRLFAVHPRI